MLRSHGEIASEDSDRQSNRKRKNLANWVGNFSWQRLGSEMRAEGNTSNRELTIHGLRLCVAINAFKRLLLGDEHIPGKPQTTSVFDSLTELGVSWSLSDRTWQNWFSDSACSPQPKKIEVLDKVSRLYMKQRSPGKTSQNAVSSPFRELVTGGLVHRIVAPTRAKRLLPVVLARAMDYEPISPLHLHLDAIEVASLADGYGDLSWQAIKSVASQRILEILDSRWNPRNGAIFDSLSSDLALEWNAASDEERQRIRKSLGAFKPDLFPRFMKDKPQPDWHRMGIKPDISSHHVYKLLFTMAVDSRFLRADRFEAWFLDLATAALAMYSLAWTDRYTTFGIGLEDEKMFWDAFDQLLFGHEQLEFDQFDIGLAMVRCDADWDEPACNMLLGARERYQAELASLGVTPEAVMSVARQGADAHPLVYVEGNQMDGASMS